MVMARFFLGLINYHAMKTYWGGLQCHTFLTLALDQGERSAGLLPEPTASLDYVEKTEITA